MFREAKSKKYEIHTDENTRESSWQVLIQRVRVVTYMPIATTYIHYRLYEYMQMLLHTTHMLDM